MHAVSAGSKTWAIFGRLHGEAATTFCAERGGEQVANRVFEQLVAILEENM